MTVWTSSRLIPMREKEDKKISNRSYVNSILAYSSWEMCQGRISTCQNDKRSFLTDDRTINTWNSRSNRFNIVFICIGISIENESVWSCMIDSGKLFGRESKCFQCEHYKRVYSCWVGKITTMVWSLVYYSIGIFMYMVLYAYEKNRTKKRVANSDFLGNLEGINGNLIQILHRRWVWWGIVWEMNGNFE